MGQTICLVWIDAFSLLQTIHVEVSVMDVDVDVSFVEALQLVTVSSWQS